MVMPVGRGFSLDGIDGQGELAVAHERRFGMEYAFENLHLLVVVVVVGGWHLHAVVVVVGWHLHAVAWYVLVFNA